MEEIWNSNPADVRVEERDEISEGTEYHPLQKIHNYKRKIVTYSTYHIINQIIVDQKLCLSIPSCCC